MTETTLYIVRHGKRCSIQLNEYKAGVIHLTKQGQEGIHYLGRGLKMSTFHLLILVTVVVQSKLPVLF